MGNFIFLFASTFLITVLGTIITDKIVEPRLEAFGGEVHGEEDQSLATVTDVQKKGLRWAGIAALIFVVIIVACCIPQGSFFRNEAGELLGKTPLIDSIVVLIALLFFIPGIIAAYSYSMAIYLLLDHPDWRVRDCLRESKRMMQGHKWEFFVLELSFIGWSLLTIIPVVRIYVTPYVQLTRAEFYNRLAGFTACAQEEKAPWEY